MFESVLIANRGEIAVRITRTLRRLGIRSIAVFSDADAGARHTLEADVAHRLGPTPAALSYLSIDRVIDAALAHGADAIHPGYGFLAENVDLALACQAAGIVFIGPPPSAIRAMGDKIRSKEMVAANGVRVVPGVSGVGLDDRELIEQAMSVGFPMLIKPSAGGGGKGMRLVTSVEALPDEIASAKREAAGAFGDDTLLIERFVERPRHIEVQVLADGFGHIVHLGERECTLQRRHQKVIEEAPSPFLSDDARAAICAQGVAAAAACGYVNAGTVEFIVSGNNPDEAFFMEMNTRLQVEHPVTEMVWGIDLVEMQLAIASGAALPFEQSDLRPNGHSFEARIYAEDPERDFLPTGGRVLALHEPVGQAGVRVDSSLQAGTLVGSTYDPMLAKVIVWDKDRHGARVGLRRALEATSVLGLTTNVAFLRDVLGDAAVISAAMDTSLVERIAKRQPSSPVPAHISFVAAALALARATMPGLASGSGSAWDVGDTWRSGAPSWATWTAVSSDGPVEVILRRAAMPDSYEVRDGHGGVEHVVISTSTQAGSIERSGRRSHFTFAAAGAVTWIGEDGATWSFVEPQPSAPGVNAGTSNRSVVKSPMPGTVVRVFVAVGDVVAAGQNLVIVEAMKMEHVLRAAADGVVAEVLVRAGDLARLNEVLIIVEPAQLLETS
ncbi:MAG: accA2 [Ilumatobacteraceae bacterium]|nr:accA2 [Ilumatobacteraceae bacterium]